MKRLYLVRHGESDSNAGGRTEAHHSTGITTRGHGQARTLAERWDHGAPGLIVTSPFIRTKLTAAPFIKRYNYAAKAEWAVQEFTQLTPSKWRGTTHEERGPDIAAYWAKGDPRHTDGPGAESFVDLFGRVRDMFKLAEEAEEETIVAFTHGTFTQAAMWYVLAERRPSTSAAMGRFLQFAKILEIDNTAVVPFRHDEGWHVGGVQSPR